MKTERKRDTIVTVKPFSQPSFEEHHKRKLNPSGRDNERNGVVVVEKENGCKKFNARHQYILKERKTDTRKE